MTARGRTQCAPTRLMIRLLNKLEFGKEKGDMMQKENLLFWQDKFDTESHLFSTNREQPYLDAENIDFEMQFNKRTAYLKITRLSQKGLEHFVQNYGKSCRVLYLYECTQIHDFAPLGELKNLEAIRIEWCRKTNQLWNMSGNPLLKVLSISDAKKIAENPRLLQTSKTLEEIRIWGPLSGGTYTMESLESFQDMKSLRRIDLNWIKLANKSMEVLDTLPNLKEFHFEPGMLTTEEIAQIVAKYPNLYGDSLRAYDDEYIDIGEVRVCGSRKPTLYLPKQQKRLEEYIKQFNMLVEKYRENL